MYITVKMKLATACVSLNISFNEGLKRNCFFFSGFFFLARGGERESTGWRR